MAMPARHTRLTAEEFQRLPEPSDGSKVELLHGNVVRHMPTGDIHGEIISLFIAAMVPFVMEYQLGVVDSNVGHTVERNPDTVLGPDVA